MHETEDVEGARELEKRGRRKGGSRVAKLALPCTYVVVADLQGGPPAPGALPFGTSAACGLLQAGGGSQAGFQASLLLRFCSLRTCLGVQILEPKFTDTSSPF